MKKVKQSKSTARRVKAMEDGKRAKNARKIFLEERRRENNKKSYARAAARKAKNAEPLFYKSGLKLDSIKPKEL